MLSHGRPWTKISVKVSLKTSKISSKGTNLSINLARILQRNNIMRDMSVVGFQFLNTYMCLIEEYIHQSNKGEQQQQQQRTLYGR